MTQPPSELSSTHQNNPSANSRQHTRQQLRDEIGAIGPMDRSSRRRMHAAQKSLATNAKDLVRLFQLMLLLIAIQIGILIWGAWWGQHVQSTESIGVLQSMTAGSGGRGGAVIEVRVPLENGSTETRFYPLDQPMAAAKGAQLVLEYRGNSRYFICDAQGQSCARTASHMLR